MEKKTMEGRIGKEWRSFCNAVKTSNETFYLVLLTAYVLVYLILKTSWSNAAKPVVSNIRYGVLSVVMWGSTIHLFFIIVAWKKLWNKVPALLIIGGALLGSTGYFSTKMDTNIYGVLMDLFFYLMAYGKNYKKMLKCVCWTTLAMLIIAYLCLLKGLTFERVKIDGTGGHSLGMNYPNSWGYMVFLVLMTGWYCYLRNKPLLTFVIFWPISLFMYFYVLCRTIALLTIIFPVMALGVDWLEKRESKPGDNVGIIGWFWTLVPVFALAFVLFVSMNYEWVHANIPNSNLLGTLRTRFVQNGLFLKGFGVRLFGNSYNNMYTPIIQVNGEGIMPTILDCSYISYAIMRGSVWLAYTIIWICIANYRAYRRRDYGTLFLSTILVIFSMIERVGLEMWYCFILLYPLAKVDLKTGETLARVPEPAMAVEGVSTEGAQTLLNESVSEAAVEETENMGIEAADDSQAGSLGGTEKNQ